MICSICHRELKKDEKPAFTDENEGVDFAICQACAHHSGGVILDDEVDDDDRGEYGFGGDWWKHDNSVPEDPD